MEPFFELTSPPDGSGYSKGAPIPFQANVGGLGTEGSLSWQSNVDGIIETDSPEFFSARLSEGTHTVTARAEFADGTEISDSVTIEVTNQAPQVTLVAPSDGASFCVDETVSLRALTQDIDLEEIPDGSVQWSFAGTSLGTGHSLEHTFTAADTSSLMVSAATATDSDGMSRSQTFVVRISGGLC